MKDYDEAESFENYDDLVNYWSKKKILKDSKQGNMEN